MVQLFVNHLKVKSFICLLSLVTFGTKICELATKFSYLVSKKQLDFFCYEPWTCILWINTRADSIITNTLHSYPQRFDRMFIDYLSVWFKYMTCIPCCLSKLNCWYTRECLNAAIPELWTAFHLLFLNYMLIIFLS